MAKELTEVQKVKKQIKERNLKLKQNKKDQLEIEKQKKFEKDLCAKVEKMTKEERIEFLTKLSDKLQIIEAKIKDWQLKKEKAENEEYYELDKADKLIINIVSGMLCGVTTGLLVGFTKGEEIGYISTCAASLAGFWMVGPLAGMGVNNKRLFNSIKKLNVTTADKKIVKLNDLQLKLAKQVEIVKKIAGEQAINPEGVAYLTLEPSKTGEGVAYLVLEPNEKDSKIKQTKCKEIIK